MAALIPIDDAEALRLGRRAFLTRLQTANAENIGTTIAAMKSLLSDVGGNAPPSNWRGALGAHVADLHDQMARRSDLKATLASLT